MTELNDLALQSKNMNTRNGKLIAGLKERTNTSLRVLRPEAASISLYGDGAVPPKIPWVLVYSGVPESLNWLKTPHLLPVFSNHFHKHGQRPHP